MKIKEQISIIDDCIASKSKLSEVLKAKKMSYDDLRYISQSTPQHFDPIETIDNVEKFFDGIPAISFFSGAGGLDIGFSYAGFNNIASIEFEPLFCKTLRQNWPDKLVIGPPDYSGNVKNHEEIASVIREKLNVQSDFNGVFHGGPPCQPFSIASNQRFNKNGENFKRKGFEDPEKGNLLFDYLWFIKEFRPQGFLIENVSGLIELDGDDKVSKALTELANFGYAISTPKVLNAAYFGVPQNRNRCIILGVRGNIKPVLPEPSESPTPCGSVFDKSLQDVKNHITREHSAESVKRYMALSYGERDQLGRVDRLDPSKPSKTVIAGGTKGGGRSHLHPYYPRTISVRECARIQTFPEEYDFLGPVARQFTQVGNAVPPLFAYKLAKALKQALFDNGYTY